MYTILYALWNP